MNIFSRILFASTVLAGCVGDSTSDIESAANGNGGGGGGGSAQLSGALFTTTVDGSRVNANIYRAKEDVYIDGGPGNGAPAKAAALPAGDYYFQVTDPSGHTLLSLDALDCRRVRITADGVIDHSYAGTGCQHATGIDMDQASLGAITVQLMPYADTPNNGGVYKAWITRVEDIGPNGKFLPSRSKTDNFKVRTVTPPPPPPPGPSCGDGHVDAGESCDDGNTTSGDGCSAMCQPENPPPPPPPPPACGDGHLDDGEQCDDGNTTSADGCSSMCTNEDEPPPSCGNGIMEGTEQCDDGNMTNGDGCSSMCVCEDVEMHEMRVGS
jgi:cysteine-rich repeat protein